MKLLLDTHTFVWFITDDPHLSNAARVLLADETVDVMLSYVCLWEIAIKTNLGKYSPGMSFEQLLINHVNGNRFSLLSMQIPHITQVSKLPSHHRDPFDRLLIAQAMVEQATVVGKDQAFDQYEVSRF